MLSPDKVKGFIIGIRSGYNAPGIFHSLPISFRVDADRYRRDQSVKKDHIFYEFIYTNNNFTLYGRTRKWLKKMNGRWNFEELVALLKN